MAYRILCLDGGGVRGLLTATLLKRLDDEPSIKGWREHTHMIAGTSTGGLMALGLGLGKKPADLVRFYRDQSPHIFDRSALREVSDLGSLLGAKYDNQRLQQTVKSLLGAGTQLQDLEPTLVIPTFTLDSSHPYQDGTGDSRRVTTWKPKIFHNDTADEGGHDGGELAYEIGMRTSAAPTYFPSYGRFVDGGVVANNPSMVALAQALKGASGKQPDRALDKMVLLSLGTGVRQTHISGEDHDWGDVEWLKAGIVDLLLDGTMDIARYQCERLLGERTLRVSPYLEANIALDDASAKTLKKLEKIANDLKLEKIVEWIENYWMP